MKHEVNIDFITYILFDLKKTFKSICIINDPNIQIYFNTATLSDSLRWFEDL